MAPNAISSVPNKLWAMIKSYGPSISYHAIADALKIEHGREDKHSRLWNLIFQNEE
jgi:hypothetical protein